MFDRIYRSRWFFISQTFWFNNCILWWFWFDCNIIRHLFLFRMIINRRYINLESLIIYISKSIIWYYFVVYPCLLFCQVCQDQPDCSNSNFYYVSFDSKYEFSKTCQLNRFSAYMLKIRLNSWHPWALTSMYNEIKHCMSK